MAELQRAGMLRPGLDLEWAAMHTRLLGRPFLAKRQVERWKQATTALFVAGEMRQD